MLYHSALLCRRCATDNHRGPASRWTLTRGTLICRAERLRSARQRGRMSLAKELAGVVYV